MTQEVERYAACAIGLQGLAPAAGSYVSRIESGQAEAYEHAVYLALCCEQPPDDLMLSSLSPMSHFSALPTADIGQGSRLGVVEGCKGTGRGGAGKWHPRTAYY